MNKISLYKIYFGFLRSIINRSRNNGKIKAIISNRQGRRELEQGFRYGEKHCFRMRCRAVLLKADGLSADKAGEQTEMTGISVRSWVRRFEAEGIKGLETRPGRGRKPIMDCSDEEIVSRAIEQDR